MGDTAMQRVISKQNFGHLIEQACFEDTDFRHEIERAKDYDAYQYAFDTAYDLFCHHFLSLREAFGLTERR